MVTTTVREEAPRFIAAIRQDNKAAFGRANEANLVDALRRAGAVTLSLVALQNDHVVGHVLFTPVIIESTDSTFEAVALGPMAVLPGYQRQGIGSQLVRAGLDRLRQMGHQVVVVLGHPGYYPRFGFKTAQLFGITSEFDVPAEVFMALELQDSALAVARGRVKYRSEFKSV